MRNYTDISAWQRFLDSRDDKLANPFARDLLGQDACFLYCETTAPLPCASMAGVWLAYPSPQKVAAHLNYAILPNLFSIWLCRDEWDANAQKAITLQDLFAGARKAENRYVADIPRMEVLAGLVGSAMRTRTGAAVWRNIEAACKKFNARWKRTATWNFVLEPYRNPEAVARDIIRRGSCSVDNKELRDLAARALSDRKAQRDFKSILAECAVY